jgi:hypothetical protein
MKPDTQSHDCLTTGIKQNQPFLMGVMGILLLLLQGCATAPSLSPTEAAQNQAKAAYLVGDYQRTLAIIMPLADGGEAWAQYTLGYMYYYGHGVRQDRQTAKQWIQSAAAKGYAPAQQAMQRLSTPPSTAEDENNEPAKPVPDTTGKAVAPALPESKEQAPAETTPQFSPVTPTPSVQQPAPPAPQPDQPSAPSVQEMKPATPPVEPSDAPPSTAAPPKPSSQEEMINEYPHAAESTPSPAASLSAQSISRPPTAQTDKGADRAPPAPTLSKGIRTRDWISHQDPQHFTVQLISSENEEAVVRFIREHHIEKQAAYYSVTHSGKIWYSVVYGNYADHSAARHALSRLPHAMRRDAPRVRNFQDIQTQFKPAP